MHRSPGLRCVSPCYRNRAVCLPRRKLILRSTIYPAICLPQCWHTVTKYHLKNRGVGKRTIRYRRLRYHIPHRLKNRGTPKPYHFLRFPKTLPCRALLFLSSKTPRGRYFRITLWSAPGGVYSVFYGITRLLLYDSFPLRSGTYQYCIINSSSPEYVNEVPFSL